MRRAALFLVLFVVACGTGSAADQNPYAGRTEGTQAGAKLFRRHCAECHGADAGGHGAAPSLRTSWVHGRSDRALFTFLTNGNLRRGMPSWSRIPEERRWQLIAYLRSLRSE
jgi:mono/diheme cytochrome c family protein